MAHRRRRPSTVASARNVIYGTGVRERDRALPEPQRRVQKGPLARPARRAGELLRRAVQRCAGNEPGLIRQDAEPGREAIGAGRRGSADLRLLRHGRGRQDRLLRVHLCGHFVHPDGQPGATRSHIFDIRHGQHAVVQSPRVRDDDRDHPQDQPRERGHQGKARRENGLDNQQLLHQRRRLLHRHLHHGRLDARRHPPLAAKARPLRRGRGRPHHLRQRAHRGRPQVPRGRRARRDLRKPQERHRGPAARRAGHLGPEQGGAVRAQQALEDHRDKVRPVAEGRPVFGRDHEQPGAPAVRVRLPLPRHAQQPHVQPREQAHLPHRPGGHQARPADQHADLRHAEPGRHPLHRHLGAPLRHLRRRRAAHDLRLGQRRHEARGQPRRPLPQKRHRHHPLLPRRRLHRMRHARRRQHHRHPGPPETRQRRERKYPRFTQPPASRRSQARPKDCST